MRKTKRLGCAAVSLTMASVAGPALAEKAAENPDRKPWSNETEFNLAFTEGNSNTGTLGLKNTLVRRWSTARFRLKLEALRSANFDDWYLQVDPGFTWQPGEDPSASVTKSLVKPPTEPDAENYFAEGRYDREIRSSLSWHAGTSWDRNEDAGILNRVIAFTGLGNLWLNQTDHRLLTSYGLSWTDREEESPDPEKEDRFAGARASLQYLNKFGGATTYDNDTVFNMSLADTRDWSADMTNSLSVLMSRWLSLRVSLRWLYNNEPALEDIDVLARVGLRDPDGVPGSGDEYFETLAEGGIEIAVGESSVRKERLDQIFKTTLVVSF